MKKVKQTVKHTITTIQQQQGFASKSETQAREAENNPSPPWHQGNKIRRKRNPTTNKLELIEKYKEEQFVQEVELFTYEKTTHTSILNTDFI